MSSGGTYHLSHPSGFELLSIPLQCRFVDAVIVNDANNDLPVLALKPIVDNLFVRQLQCLPRGPNCLGCRLNSVGTLNSRGNGAAVVRWARSIFVPGRAFVSGGARYAACQ